MMRVSGTSNTEDIETEQADGTFLRHTPSQGIKTNIFIYKLSYIEKKEDVTSNRNNMGDSPLNEIV